ncbi:hypothetical protein GW17_00006136 [Ensete ventricosum]|nr:hypothetical protein GW17_00006136 [Ensete ventricosum]
MARRILVTGGAGYIGSHTVLQLLLAGFGVVVVDNLDNSSEVAVERVTAIAGKYGKNLTFHRVPSLFSCSVHEHSALKFRFDAVVHFAGLKAVGESVQKPLLYYNNNIIGTIALLEAMVRHGCKKYGLTVLDYIHVVDLADGHIAALQKLFKASNLGAYAKFRCEVYNLGTGKGTSVLEMVAAFEKTSGKLDFHLWAIVIATRNRTPDEYTIHLRSRNHIKILEFDLSAFISSDRNLGDDAHFDAGSVVPYVPDAVTESPVSSICSSPVTSSSLPCKRSEQLKQTGNLTVVLRALM